MDNCGGTRYPTANASWINFRKGIDGCAAAGGRRMALSVEYCRGGELFHFILERKHLTEREAALIMKQLLSALMYLHNNNISHR